MADIQIDDKSVRAALAGINRRLTGDLRVVLADIGEDITQRAKARFDSSTGPDGKTWLPKKRPDGRKTLVGESGDLRRQITSSATSNALTVVASAAYAAIQQFGGTIERKAGMVTVRHRTNAKGELLRSAIMNGRGLVFAKRSHKRALERQFERAAHKISIPARPFMPVRPDGSLYEGEEAAIVAQITEWIAGV